MNSLLIKAKNNFNSLTNNEKNQLNYFVSIIDNNRYNTINIIINKIVSWFNITEETLSRHWIDDEWYSAGLELFDITTNTIYSNKNIYHLWIAINNYFCGNNTIPEPPHFLRPHQVNIINQINREYFSNRLIYNDIIGENYYMSNTTNNGNTTNTNIH